MGRSIDTGARLRALRGDRKQTDVAADAGISQGQLSELENGKPIKNSVALRLANVLGDGVLGLVSSEDDRREGFLTTEEAGATMKPPETREAVRKLCSSGRIPGAKKMYVDGRDRWMVPIGFQVIPPDKWGYLSERKKNNIARKYLGGKSGSDLAREYDIDQSYPRHLVNRGYPKVG